MDKNTVRLSIITCREKLMPYIPNKPCASPGCRNLVPHDQKFCQIHKPHSIIDNRKPSSQRGYGKEFKKKRERFLAEHPYCQAVINGIPCGQPSNTVHHRKALSDGGLDVPENYVAFCQVHHTMYEKSIDKPGIADA